MTETIRDEFYFFIFLAITFCENCPHLALLQSSWESAGTVTQATMPQ